jgi:hypothetical protein
MNWPGIDGCLPLSSCLSSVNQWKKGASWCCKWLCSSERLLALSANQGIMLPLSFSINGCLHKWKSSHKSPRIYEKRRFELIMTISEHGQPLLISEHGSDVTWGTWTAGNLWTQWQGATARRSPQLSFLRVSQNAKFRTCWLWPNKRLKVPWLIYCEREKYCWPIENKRVKAREHAANH